MKPAAITAAAAAFSVAVGLAAAAWLSPLPPEDEAPDEERALEIHLRQAPRDARGWVMLARLRMDGNRFDSAADAYERALSASRKVAADPLIWCELADALGMAQGGSLKGRPRELIGKALALKPTHPRALEMAGSAEYEAGNYSDAMEHWELLLKELRAGSAEQRQLSTAIARARELSEGR